MLVPSCCELQLPNPQILLISITSLCTNADESQAKFLISLSTSTSRTEIMNRHSRSKGRRSNAVSNLDPLGFGFGFGFDPLSVDPNRKQGDSQLRKHTKSSKKSLQSSTGNGAPLEENFIGLEFKSTSSRKSSRTPIETIMDKEMSKELELRRPSPSLVARLMGLDTLPAPVVSYKQKQRVRNCQKNLSVGFRENYAAYEGYSRWRHTKEYQECKDVFEVTERPKVDKYDNQPISEMSSLKQSENDMVFIKHKFLDAKYLSTDDAYQHPKEHHEALEVLGSNEDHFQNVLEESNPLFKMHLQDLKCSPLSPHASDVIILKPSKSTNYESSELCYKSEKYAQRRYQKQKSDSRKSEAHTVDQSLKEHGPYLPCKLSDLRYTGEVKDLLQPAQIVLLKPSLENAWGIAKNIPLARSSENDFGLRRHRKVPTRTSEFNAEEQERNKLSDSVEVMGHKTRSSRKIARNITEEVRNTGGRGRKEGSASNIYGHIGDGSSFGLSCTESLNSKLFQSTSHRLYDCSDKVSTSSSTSTESLHRREARNHLSEQWKMNHLFQEVRPVAKRSSTLGEMLASYDRETQRKDLNTSIAQNLSNGKLARDGVSERWDLPMGISSKDGWMDGWYGYSPSSEFHPASSLVYQNHKPRRGSRFGGSERSYLKNVINKSPNDAADRNHRLRRTPSLKNFRYCHNDAQFYTGREEIQMSEREIHVNSEELRDRIHGDHPIEKVYVVPEVCNNSFAGERKASMLHKLHMNSFVGQAPEPHNNSSQEFDHSKLPPIIDGQQNKESAPAGKDEEFPCNKRNILLAKETSIDSPLSSEEIDQRTSVPVLEPLPSEEDKSAFFRKISSDLQELQLQLKLLELESADTYAADLDVLISSEEDNGERYSLPNSGERLEAFRDDDDRDFSYLLDLLIDSGFHDAIHGGLLFACRSQYSVCFEVFEKLEKKYSMLVSWSRSERKLFFDLISSVLVDVIDTSYNLLFANTRVWPIWAGEDLVEKVWQMVVKRRKEVSGKLDELLLDPRWLNLGDDADIVGKDLEKMIIEDLMEELYCQLLSE